MITKKISKKALLYGIGILIFAIILTRIDIGAVLSLLTKVNIKYFLLAIPLILFMTVVRTLRWQYVLQRQNIKLNFQESFLIYLNAIFWGTITPARSGEFAKAIYLKNKGYSFNQSLSNTIVDRLFDVASVLILGYTGLIIFSKLFQRELYIFSIVIALLILISLVIFYKKRPFFSLIERLLKFKDFYNNLKILNSSIIIKGIILSLLAWFIYFIQIYILNISLDLHIPFLFIAIAVSISSLLNLLPITISGIGTRDIIFILIFSQVGIVKESAIALSALVLFVFMINGFIGWLSGFFIRKHPPEMEPTDI